MKTERYIHHGNDVAVLSHVKGKHRENCLCFGCVHFKPGQPDNCEIAQENYALCVKHKLVTPVFECPKFEAAPQKGMLPIEEAFPEAAASNNKYNPGFPDYEELVKSMTHEILLQVDDDDYQGDSRYILKDGERYGILIFGWGSCSGCDALQACTTLTEVGQLRDKLVSDIQWFETKGKCLHYFDSHNWEGDYSWFATETQDFVKKAKALLSA